MKSRIALFLLVSLGAGGVNACPVCERNQPAVFRDLVHGAGPESRWDYLIIGVIAAVVLLTLFLSVKWLVKPGEGSAGHIKRTVLNNW